MPLAEIHLVRRALEPEALHALVEDVTETFLRHQGARADSCAARSIARVEVHESSPTHIFVGGLPSRDPQYRIVYTVPHGSMDPAAKASLVDETTRLVLSAEGTPWSEEQAHRVWCLVNEVPDGNWGAAGRIFRWRDVMRWVARRDIAARRTARAVRRTDAVPAE